MSLTLKENYGNHNVKTMGKWEIIMGKQWKNNVNHDGKTMENNGNHKGKAMENNGKQWTSYVVQMPKPQNHVWRIPSAFCQKG